MDLLYLTADEVGVFTGGGRVTLNESRALAEVGDVAVWSFPRASRPWGADEEAVARLLADESIRPRLAHAYAGTFSQTIEILKSRGCRVTYTAAAHDVEVSKQEHERLGVPFDYPHLVDPEQWARYVRGYLLADVVICPSKLSKAVMKSYGCKDVRVIPHGVDLPAGGPKSPPKRFAAAYLGAPGPDKGVAYLLDAWAWLDYKDAVLTIAGRGTEALLGLVRQMRAGSVHLRGAVADVSAIYDTCSLYVQPSASEGFGIEVLEALAYGRPVVCADGAGAADVLDGCPREIGTVVPARDAGALARAIDWYRVNANWGMAWGYQTAEKYEWSKVRKRYVELWRSLISDRYEGLVTCAVCGRFPCPDDHVADMRNISITERVS